MARAPTKEINCTSLVIIIFRYTPMVKVHPFYKDNRAIFIKIAFSVFMIISLVLSDLKCLGVLEVNVFEYTSE